MYRCINQINLRRSPVSIYCSRCCLLELVLNYIKKSICQGWKLAIKHLFTDVTTTAPLAFTHKKITWAGVIPRRWAAFSTSASTGPPGKVVIELRDNFISKKKVLFLYWTRVKYECKASESLSDDIVFVMIVQKRYICSIIIWVQTYLCISPFEWNGRSDNEEIVDTWLTAGLTWAVLSSLSRSSTVKLLTPMLLKQSLRRKLTEESQSKHILCQALLLEPFKLPPSTLKIAIFNDCRHVDEI